MMNYNTLPIGIFLMSLGCDTGSDAGFHDSSDKGDADTNADVLSDSSISDSLQEFDSTIHTQPDTIQVCQSTRVQALYRTTIPVIVPGETVLATVTVGPYEHETQMAVIAPSDIQQGHLTVNSISLDGEPIIWQRQFLPEAGQPDRIPLTLKLKPHQSLVFSLTNPHQRTIRVTIGLTGIDLECSNAL